MYLSILSIIVKVLIKRRVLGTQNLVRIKVIMVLVCTSQGSASRMPVFLCFCVASDHKWQVAVVGAQYYM